GRPIANVSHAVTLLGWDNVRSRVSAVRYIEHYASRSPGLRELMVLSVLSAVHAREVAATLGYPRPEEAFLCSLLRNVGEVLIACYLPREYAEIILAMDRYKLTPQAACVRILSFPWEEVGLRTAATWNLPPCVQICLGGPQSAGPAPLDRCLHSIAEYGHRMTHALYRKGAGIESIHLGTIIDPQCRSTLIPLRDLHSITKSALTETERMLSALHIPVDRLRLEQQAEQAQTMLEAAPTLDVARADALEEAISEAAQSMASGEFQISRFLTQLLDALRAAGFDRAIFGLVNEAGTVIRGRLANGDCSESVLDRFDFPIDRGESPVSAALRSKLDVLVDGTRDDRYNNSALVKELDAAAFALFPVVVDRKVAGCLYAGKHGRVSGLENFRPALARVRDLIAEGIRKRHPVEEHPVPR
ncbi:MAG: HDOD domain-containing protein, partial [Bryobacteraceae bacterium]